jgi:hypothetical protein
MSENAGLGQKMLFMDGHYLTAINAGAWATVALKLSFHIRKSAPRKARARHPNSESPCRRKSPVRV